MSSRNVFLAATLVMATACASTGQPSSESVVVPPSLIDCADFGTPETDLSRQAVDVVVPISVSETGAITQVGAPRASRQQASRAVMDQAVALARTCTFEPATTDGAPTPGRTEVRFRLGVG